MTGPRGAAASSLPSRVRCFFFFSAGPPPFPPSQPPSFPLLTLPATPPFSIFFSSLFAPAAVSASCAGLAALLRRPACAHAFWVCLPILPHTSVTYCRCRGRPPPHSPPDAAVVRCPLARAPPGSARPLPVASSPLRCDPARHPAARIDAVGTCDGGRGAARRAARSWPGAAPRPPPAWRRRVDKNKENSPSIPPYDCCSPALRCSAHPRGARPFHPLPSPPSPLFPPAPPPPKPVRTSTPAVRVHRARHARVPPTRARRRPA